MDTLCKQAGAQRLFIPPFMNISPNEIALLDKLDRIASALESIAFCLKDSDLNQDTSLTAFHQLDSIADSLESIQAYTHTIAHHD